ncbi:MAG: transglutaminase-like cysteine peptidase [Alphaproteobacteria bacterium]|nr:transglutaminase-like cysteine peptidase [Alphaproteobacteria bacterium]
MGSLDVVSDGAVNTDVKLGGAFNTSRQAPVLLNGFAFRLYSSEQSPEDGLGGKLARLLRKTQSSFQRLCSVNFEVENTRYDPRYHYNIPDPAEGKASYDVWLTEIRESLGEQENFSAMPASLREDRVLRMAFAVDGYVDEKLKTSNGEHVDEVALGVNDYIFHHYTIAMRSSGDCDDYANVKRHLLRDMGVPDNRVFIVSGYDDSIDEGHAVCVVVADDGKAYMIDSNLTGKPEIIPWDEYLDKYKFRPLSASTDNGFFILSDQDYRSALHNDKASLRSSGATESSKNFLSGYSQ